MQPQNLISTTTSISKNQSSNMVNITNVTFHIYNINTFYIKNTTEYKAYLNGARNMSILVNNPDINTRTNASRNKTVTNQTHVLVLPLPPLYDQVAVIHTNTTFSSTAGSIYNYTLYLSIFKGIVISNVTTSSNAFKVLNFSSYPVPTSTGVLEGTYTTPKCSGTCKLSVLLELPNNTYDGSLNLSIMETNITFVTK